MARKPRLEQEPDDINIMPLMNIIMLLIPFLIMSTEFIKLGTINITAPNTTPGPTTQKEARTHICKKSLNLTISVTRRGLTLLTRGNKVAPGCQLTPKGATATQQPTIRKAGKDYNYTQLQQCLRKIKRLFKHEKRVVVMATPHIKYKVLVKIMDQSRGDDKEFPYAPKQGKAGLFPQVVLSAGVI